MASTQVLGIEKLTKSFKELSTSMQLRVSRRMVVVVGRIVVNAAKQNVRSAGLVRTGNMMKNIAIKRQKGTAPGIAEYHVGVRHSRDLTKKARLAGAILKKSRRTGRIFKQYKNDPFYWSFQHFGWTDRGGGKHAGTRFIEKALQANIKATTDKMGEVLRDELKKAGATTP